MPKELFQNSVNMLLVGQSLKTEGVAEETVEVVGVDGAQMGLKRLVDKKLGSLLRKHKDI